MIELTLYRPERDESSVDKVENLLETVPFDYEEVEGEEAIPVLEVDYGNEDIEIYRGLNEIDEGLSKL
jgi:hypothetical protein